MTKSAAQTALEKKMDILIEKMDTNQKSLEDKINLLQTLLTEKDQKIKKLEDRVTEKDGEIRKMETRLDDLEQYSRKEDVIVTGLKIKRTMAEIVKGQTATEQDNHGVNNTEKQVLEFLNQRDFGISEEEVTACHTLGRVNDDGTQKVIIRFISRKSKTRVMMNGKNLRGSNVYVNEHLTRKNAGLAKRARDLKKENRIESTWVRDCKIFIKVDGKPMLVRSAEDLEEL